MSDIQLFTSTLWVLLAGILLLALTPTTIKSYVSAFIVLIISVLTSIPAISVLLGANFEFILPAFGFFGQIPIRMDALSAWFIIIINLTSITGIFYGSGYMLPYLNQKGNTNQHWIEFVLFHSSMIWICVVQNSLVFLIVWELMSMFSLLLVIFEHYNNKTVKAGINYLVQMHVGVVFLTMAFIWVYVSQDSFDFVAIKSFFENHSNIWLFLLFFIGFGIKAGFIPLHSWLPQAHPAAPSHISGVMSGVIVKVGIFGVFRMITYLQTDYLLLGEIILTISILTALFGILNAAVNRDFKKMLAYCTIENIGIIGAGIGLGLIGVGIDNQYIIVLGYSGALLHVLNHSLFKSMLFYAAGSIYQQTHTKNMENLGGLIKKMPHTAIIFLIGALAISGLPPFCGFISEFMIYFGFLKGIENQNVIMNVFLIMSFGALALIGGIAILTFTKTFGTIFLGEPRTILKHEPKEVSIRMRIPQYFIILIILAMAVFPVFIFEIMQTILVQISPKVITILNSSDYNTFYNSIIKISIFSTLFFALTLVIYVIRKQLTKKVTNEISPTWGCGYIAPKATMQYTSKSFSKTLGKLLSFIMFENKLYKEIEREDVFPKKRRHSAHYVDFFENKLIKRNINRVIYFLNHFQFIQSGNLQQYIFYGLVFILSIFVISLVCGI